MTFAQVAELFFQWIKQHLRIKTFFGNSENATISQIWIAVSTYVLVAFLSVLTLIIVSTLCYWS